MNDALPAAALRRPDETLVLPYPGNWTHAADYVGRLGLPASSEPLAFFDELAFCDDRGLNAHRRQRMQSIHAQLQASLQPSGHAGIFLRRGGTGAQRLLANEDELAETLAARGFAIRRTTDPLEEILAAAAGTGVFVTMEGSNWVHGHLGARRGALILTINPADRFNNIAAVMVPALDQRLASIVASRQGDGYHVDVARLLSLMDRALDEIGGRPSPP